MIYSVDRTPERTFDTARAVQVITQEQIQHLNVQNLAQLLELQPGFGVVHSISGAMPVVRGLAGKQLLILIDGVRVNNATWRSASKEYLATIDLSQADRVEIVGGVVSVLGTASLGGVINIITKKGPAQQDAFGGSIGGRYASSEHAWSTPVSVFGFTGKLRYDIGVSYTDSGLVRGGSGVGTQQQTSYKQTGGHANGQWLLSPDKTISFGYQNVSVGDAAAPINPAIIASWDPAELQLMNVSYMDLTGRHWEDSLKVTAYWNRQHDVRNVAVAPPIALDIKQTDRDSLGGLNVELGSFLGKSHQLVYGLDYTDERVNSAAVTRSTRTGVVTPTRGNLMDGSSYRTTSLYLQDRADFSRWLTVIGGARLGKFETKGEERNAVGQFDIGAKRTNVTGALNLIGHVTPSLNVIANFVKGFRSPNLDDVSHYATRVSPPTVEVPNPGAVSEKVTSGELGLKYSKGNVNASVFYFRNEFKNLLVKANGIYNGLSYVDANGNGKRDAGESQILQNQNIGQASIKGIEADLELAVARNVFALANYSRVIGTDEIHDQPITQMPPTAGMIGIRYFGASAGRPWAELDYRFTQAQHRLSPADIADLSIGPQGTPAYQVVNLRTGLTVFDRLSLSVGLENVFDKKYRSIGSVYYQPGRQLVVGTQFHF